MESKHRGTVAVTVTLNMAVYIYEYIHIYTLTGCSLGESQPLPFEPYRKKLLEQLDYEESVYKMLLLHKLIY